MRPGVWVWYPHLTGPDPDPAQEGPDVTNPDPLPTEPVAALTRLFSQALRELGDAGKPQLASELAASAWSLLHQQHPDAGARLSGVLHYLARLHPTQSTDQAEQNTVSDRELDVRTEPPARRHELIFENYAALQPDEGFVLVNDHDPKPLYYQFEAEHHGEFSWQYLEQGPQTWRVRIGRTAHAD
jgi:Uncharacterized conserved protein